MNYFYCLIISLTLIGCNQNQVEELEDLSLDQTNFHQDTVLGWNIEIPAIWKIQTPQQIASINEKGIRSTEDAVSSKMDLNLLKNVFSFAKDSMNMFQSVREIYEKDQAAWEKNNAALKELFCGVYADQGARLDSSETTIMDIDGVKFHSYEILFYDDSEKISLVQIFYSTLLNGHDFSISICATNEQNKLELLDIWENSTFTKAE